MPEVEVTVGGRAFTVACQEGEEEYLQTAAGLLDEEASTMVEQVGRMPETRMLLMAGLMLADRTAGLDEKLRAAKEELAARETLIAELRKAPTAAPERVEVPVVPRKLGESLAEIAARTESLADAVEEKVASR